MNATPRMVDTMLALVNADPALQWFVYRIQPCDGRAVSVAAYPTPELAHAVAGALHSVGHRQCGVFRCDGAIVEHEHG